MKKTAALFPALALLLAIVFAAAPARAEDVSGSVYTVAPFSLPNKNTGKYLCQTPVGRYDSESEIVQKAGSCASMAYGFPADKLTRFVRSGPYQNCVVPTDYKTDDRTKIASWSVCCATPQPNATSPGADLDLICYRFRTEQAYDAGAGGGGVNGGNWR